MKNTTHLIIKRGVFLIILLIAINKLFSNSFEKNFSNDLYRVTSKNSISSKFSHYNTGFIINDLAPTITFQPLSNITACEGDAISISITATGNGTLTYQWKMNGVNLTDGGFIAGSTSANLTISQTQVSDTGNYTCEITDIDGTTTSNISAVTINPLPTVFAGDDQIVCNGASVTLAGSGASTYNWDNGITNNIPVIVTATTNYTVTGEDANGCINTDTVLITVNDLPNALTAIVTQPTCNSSTGSIHFSGLPASGNWTINPGSINGIGSNFTLNGISPGTYNYTVTNTFGCVSAATEVTVNTAPITPSAPIVGIPTQPTCILNTGSVDLSGLPTGTWIVDIYQNGLFLNQITDTGGSYTVNNLPPGTYTFTVSNTSCTSSESVATTINPQPTIDAPIIGTITQPTCSLSTGSVEFTGLPASGTWTLTRSPGNITTTNTGIGATVFGLSTGTYTYTVKDANGCVSPATLDIVIDSQPATPAIPTALAQSFTGTPTVSDLVATGTVGATINWYAAASGGTPLIDQTLLVSGTYYVSQEVNGCESARGAVTVSVFPNSVGGFVTGGTSVCSGINTTTLFLNSYVGDVLKWQSSTASDFLVNVTDFNNLSSTFTATNLTSSLYFRAVVQSGTSTANSAPTYIEVIEPSVGGTLTNGAPICSGNTSSLLTLTGNTGTIVRWESSINGGSSWTSIGNANNPTYTSGPLTQTTQFRVVVQNNVCSEAYSSVSEIVVNSIPSITDIPDQDVCFGTTASFGNPVPTPGYSYNWSSINGGASLATTSDYSFLVTQSDVYTLTITNNSTLCESSDTFSINMQPLPNATVIADNSICEGNAIDIGTTSVLGSSYSWSSNPPGFSSTNSNPSVMPSVTTTYTLTETVDASGCQTQNDVTINVSPDPVIDIANGPQIDICENSINVPITATISNSYTSFRWEISPVNSGALIYDTTLSPEFTPSLTGIANGYSIVKLFVTNDCGEELPEEELLINIGKQAIANAGSDISTCDISAITLDGTASLNTTIYSWSKPPYITGVLSPSNSATPTFTPSASDVANYAGVDIPFTLTASSGTSCTSTTDIVNLTIIQNPIISAGPSSTFICEDSSYTASATIDANTASYSWDNNGGDGTFSNSNTLTPTYTAGPQDKINGSVILTLSAQGNSPCLTVTSDIILNIIKNPVVSLGANTTVCASPINPINIGASIENAGTILWSTTGGGSFNGTQNLINPIYTPDISDLNTNVTFSVTVTPINPCGTTVVKNVIYTINEIPTVDAGGDVTICETNTTFHLQATVLNASSIEWTSTGSGSFDNAFNEDPIYTLSPNDILTGNVTFTLEASQASCSSVTDSMVLTIQKNPVADAGLAQIICQGSQAVMLGTATNASGVTWIRSGGSGTFINDTTLNPTYSSTSTEEGTILLTLIANPIGPCVTPSLPSNTTISVVANPTADAGIDGQICEGESFQITTASATNNTGNVTWTTSGDGSFTGGTTLTPTYYPGPNDNNSGSVVLTIIAEKDFPCNSDAFDQMTLTINKIPSITVINPVIDLCTGTTSYDIEGVTAYDYDTLEWTSPTGGTFTPTPNPLNTTTVTTYNPTASDFATGSVTLTLKASRDPLNCNSSVTNSITLNFIEEPIADAGPTEVTICEATTYTTNGATAANYSTLVWSSSGSAGTLSNASTLLANYTPSAEDIAAGSVILTLTANSVNPCNATAVDTILINFEPLPIITTIGTDTICESSTTYAIGGTSILNNYQTVTLANWSSSGTGTFSSSGDPLNPIYTPSAADISSGQVTLTLTVNSNTPCITTQSGEIILNFIPEPIASAGPDLNQCETQFTITTASATSGTYSSLGWTTSGSGTFANGITNILNPTYEPSTADIAAGTVDLTLTAYPISPCALPSVSTITVSIAALPIITTASQAPICEDETNVEVLGTTIINALNYTYSSTTGTIINNPTSLNPTVTPSATDISNGFINLTIEATPTLNCGTSPITETVTIPIVRNPVVNAGSPQTICENETITTTSATSSFVDISAGDLQWSGTGGTFLTPSNALVTTYQPSQTEIDNGIATLTLTGTATTPCSSTSISTVSYTIVKNPSLTVNPTIVTICESDSYQIQPGQVVISNINSVDYVTWTASSPGTIIQGSTLDLEPVFTPSITDIANGYSDLTITVTPLDACVTNTVSETIRVNISPLATIDATQTTYTFCEGTPKQLEAVYTNEDASTYNWQIVSGTGSISNNTLATPQYIPANDSDNVVIRVEVTGNAPCDQVIFEEFTLNKISAPIVTLPLNTDTVCNSQNDYNLSATITNTTANTTYLWTSSSSSATFSNPTSPTSTYSFSATDIANGSVTLRLTATSDSICAMTDYDEIVITIEEAPIVTLTNLITEICEGETFNATATASNATAYLWEVVGTSDGTFTNANDLNLAEYTPGITDVSTGSFTIQLSATGNSSCGTTVEEQTVTIISPPSVDAGLENRTNCASEAFDITGVTAQNYSSLLWTSESGDPGTFSNNTIENPTYTPSASEIAAGLPIVLRLTAQPNSPCALPTSDFIFLNLSPQQIVDAGSQQSICEDAIVNLVGSVTNSSSVYWTTSSATTSTSFSNPNSTTSIYTPSALDISTGSVNLTLHAVSDTNCPEVEDTIEINIIKKPTASAGPSATICEGSSYTLMASEATVTNEDSVLWTVSGGGTILAGTETTLTPTFVPDPNQTGTVTLTLTAFANATCGTANNAISTKTITIIPTPVVSIPSTRTICQGTSLEILDSEVTATNYESLSWTSSNGLGTFAPSNAAATTYTPDVNQTGTVTLTLTAYALDGSCTNITGDILLTIEPSLTVDAGLGGTICEDENFTVLGATITNGSGVFNWSIVGPATIASGTETTLEPEIIPNSGASGIVTLTLEAIGTGNCPTPTNDSVSITINPLPIVDAGNSVEACEGIASIPLVGTATNGVIYTWTHNGAGSIETTTDPLIANYIPGTADFINPSGINVVQVFLEATGIGTCGTVTSTAKEITLYANPSVFAGIDASICEGETYALIGATATNYSALNWDDGTANGTFDFTGPGGVLNPTYIVNPADSGIITLTLTAEPNAACLPTATIFKSSMQLTVEKNPTIVANNSEINLCGDTFTLPDLLTVNNASGISWVNITPVSPISIPANATSETPTLSPTNAELANGFMLLEVTANPLNPCTTTASEIIRVNLTPNATVIAGTPINECETSSPILLNFGASVSPSTSFYWSENGTGTITSGLNSLSPTYTPGPNETGSITFTLHATNPSPCLGEITDSVILTINPQPTIFAGSDATICEGSSYNINDATMSNTNSIQWRSYISSAGIVPSDGTFNDDSIINTTYTPSQNDITRGEVYLIATAENNCSVVNDVIKLTITPGVGVFAGAPATICEGSNYTLVDATAANSSSVNWLSSQNSNGTSSPTYIGGTFNTSASVLNATYTPSSDDINLGYVYLTLVGTGDLSCAINTSVMRLDITPNPSITITSSNVAICVSTPSVILNSSAANYSSINWSIFSGPGSITAGETTENPTFTTGLSTDITTIQTTIARAVLTPYNGCSTPITKDIEITIQPLPTVDAGDNGEVCYIPGNPIPVFTIYNASVLNASSQVWTTSGIGTFTSGTPTTYQSLSNNCPSTETLTLTATGVGACSLQTVSDSNTLTINCAPPNLGSITSTESTTLCAGTSSVVYQVSADPSVTSYTWTVPSGASIISGLNTNTIVVDYGANAVDGNVGVYATNSCGSGPFSTLPITILPVPSAPSISTSATQVCPGETGVQLTATPVNGALSYIWTLPSGVSGSSFTNSIVVDFATSATSGNITVQAVNSCGVGIESSIYIDVLPLPSLTTTATTPICSGDTFTYELNSTPNITYTWDRALQSGLEGTVSGIGSTISDIIVNTTSTVQTATYTINLTSSDGCTATEYINVSVDPIPQLTNTPSLSEICSGDTFSYNPTSNTSGSISWSRATTTGIAETGSTGNTSPINETLTNTTSDIITVEYDLIITTLNGCSNTFTIFVDVTPTPKAATNLTGPTTVCAGSSNNIYTVDIIDNATTYEWTLPNGNIQTTTSNTITVDYLLTDTSGTLKVLGKNACGNGSSTSLYIDIIAPIQLIITNPSDICLGNTVNLTLPDITNGSDNGLTFTYWLDDLATIPVNNPLAVLDGTYYIKAINSNGCSTIKPVTVTAIDLPSVTVNNVSICSGSVATITATPTTIGNYDYSWSSTTNPSFNPGNVASFTTTLAGDYTVIITDTSFPNCTSLPATGNVTVNTLLPTATISSPLTVCENGNAVITFTGANGISPYTFEYTINGGATQTISTTANSNSVDLAINTSVVGFFTYQLINVEESSDSSCSQNQSENTSIEVIATPTLSSSLSEMICSNEEFQYTATSNQDINFSWVREEIPGISNNANSGNNATINETLLNTTTAPITVNYIFTLQSIDGCSNIQTVAVTVNPLPSLDFESSAPPTAICSGEAFIFTPVLNTNPATISNSISWTRADNAFISAGPNTGSGPIINDVLINTSTNMVPVVYTITLPTTTAPQSCSATETIIVEVYPLPIAVISGGGDTCFNSDENLVTFTGANGVAPYTFEYEIDGVPGYSITTTSGNSVQVASSSSTIGSHTYTLVTVADANGCSQTINAQSTTINVIESPVLVITNPATICENDTVDLTDISITAGSETGLLYTYFTNATATTQYLTPTVATGGTYYIKATNSIGCSSIQPVIVTTNPIPTVSVNNSIICDGDTATITATPNPPGLYDYNWTNLPVGVPNPGNVASFTTTTAGNYTVDITSQTQPNCVSLTAVGNVSINPLPTATVSGSTAEICTDEIATINFTGNNGTSPYTFTYNINGGTTQTIISSGTTATINIDTSISGIYTFNLLSVTDSSTTACNQLLNGESFTIEVLPPPSINIVNPAPICEGETVNLVTTISPFDSGLTYSYWENIGATIPINTPNAVGEGTFFIKATNNIGCSNIAEVIVTTIPLPTVSVNNQFICEGESATITAITSISGNYNYNWTVPSGVTNPGNVASFTTATAGDYSVFITDVNNANCKSETAVGVVTINPLPNGVISLSETEVCLNTPVTVTFTGADGTAPYIFEYLDENGATKTIVSSGTNLNTAEIQVPTNSSSIKTYTLVSISDSSETACSQLQNTSVSIIVRELPIVDAGPTYIEVCSGEEVTLNASGTATSYSWNNGITDGVAFTPLVSATYTLTGIDNFGCENTDDITITMVPSITGTIKAPFDFTVCKNDTAPAITFVAENGTAPYIFTYQITSALLTTPITGTITSNGNEATLIPEIPTGISGDFVVTLTNIEDSGSCNNGNITEPSQAFITVLEAGILPAANNLINVNQIICEGENIIDIVFDIAGSPTEAFAEGLPENVQSIYNVSEGTLTISGAPTQSGIFEYTVKTSGSVIGCNAEFSGSIEVNPKGTLSITNPNNTQQTVCINSPITTITYNLEGSATNVEVLNLPNGVNYSLNGTTVTIAGTPTEIGEFTYTITPYSTTTNCEQISETGSITVTETEITLVSGEPNQTICVNNNIENIVFTITNNPSLASNASLILTGDLPTGVTFDESTGIITGTPLQAGIFEYAIESSTGCGNAIFGTLTINDGSPNVQIEGGLQEIEACIGSEITLTATGADSYEWYNLNDIGVPTTLGNSNTYTYTPIINETIYVIGTIADGCDTTASINVLLKQPITATITGVNTFEVCKNSPEPTITFNATNGTAPYTFTYTIGNITHTIETLGTSSSAVIAIPTNVAGIFDIQLLNVEDSSNSIYCSPPTLLEPTSAIVTVLDSGITPQADSEIYQTICEGETITAISFDILGNATSAYVEGLPSGVTSSFAGNTLTISGTPTVTGNFIYNVYTAGLDSNCNASFEGSITITPNNEITLLSNGNDNQAICVNSSIETITYQLTNGATGATITGLPSGITWNIEEDILTISGEVNDVAGSYNFTINTQGTCASATAVGVISIIDAASISLTSGNENQEVCINTPITSINFQGAVGQTLKLNGVLPHGVTFNVNPLNPHIATISGTPTLSGNYEYGITTENSCTEELKGSILVKESANITYVSGSLNQSVCIGSELETIVYYVPLSVVNLTFTPNLPNGIEYSLIDGVIRVGGIPTLPLNETTYEISATNGCGTEAKTSFKLTFEDSPEILLESDSGSLTQQVCQNDEITPIKFIINGNATGIDESILPSFINVEVDSNGIYTLSGAPLYTGAFEFEIKTVGDSLCDTSLIVRIENTYADVSILLISDVGKDNQTICTSGTPIEDIVYQIDGNNINPSLINVTGLPSGVTANTIVSTTGVLLTLSGQPTVSGIYEYGIEYNNCGGAIKSGVISISSPTTISAEVTQISCDGDDGEISVTIFGGVPFIDESGNPLYEINWEGPNGFRQNQTTITGLVPGDYTISGFDAIGCALPTQTFTINPATPLVVELLNTTSPNCNEICTNLDYSGGTGIYTKFVLEVSTPQSQQWTEITPNNNNYYNICGLETGMYRVSVTDSNNCTSTPYVFTVENNGQLSIEDIIIDSSICEGYQGYIYAEVISIDANLSFYYNEVSLAYTNLGDNLYQLEINDPGLNGILKVTNSQGCSDEMMISTQTVDDNDFDFEYTSLDFASVGYIGVNSSIEFTNLSTIGNPINYNHIVWDFGDNTPYKVFYNPQNLEFNADGENIKTVFHTYTNDGIYNVTLSVFNSTGCSKSITKTIIIGKGATIILPTIFSPNNDGINDYFGPSFNGLKEITMYIYDAWGNLVYEVSNNDISSKNNLGELRWNGIEPINSEPKNGSYRCYIIAKTLDDKKIEKTGRFLIVQ